MSRVRSQRKPGNDITNVIRGEEVRGGRKPKSRVSASGRQRRSLEREQPLSTPKSKHSKAKRTTAPKTAATRTPASKTSTALPKKGTPSIRSQSRRPRRKNHRNTAADKPKGKPKSRAKPKAELKLEPKPKCKASRKSAAAPPTAECREKQSQRGSPKKGKRGAFDKKPRIHPPPRNLSPKKKQPTIDAPKIKAQKSAGIKQRAAAPDSRVSAKRRELSPEFKCRGRHRLHEAGHRSERASPPKPRSRGRFESSKSRLRGRFESESSSKPRSRGRFELPKRRPSHATPVAPISKGQIRKSALPPPMRTVSPVSRRFDSEDDSDKENRVVRHSASTGGRFFRPGDCQRRRPRAFAQRMEAPGRGHRMERHEGGRMGGRYREGPRDFERGFERGFQGGFGRGFGRGFQRFDERPKRYGKSPKKESSSSRWRRDGSSQMPRCKPKPMTPPRVEDVDLKEDVKQHLEVQTIAKVPMASVKVHKVKVAERVDGRIATRKKSCRNMHTSFRKMGLPSDSENEDSGASCVVVTDMRSDIDIMLGLPLTTTTTTKLSPVKASETSSSSGHLMKSSSNLFFNDPSICGVIPMSSCVSGASAMVLPVAVPLMQTPSYSLSPPPPSLSLARTSSSMASLLMQPLPPPRCKRCDRSVDDCTGVPLIALDLDQTLIDAHPVDVRKLLSKADFTTIYEGVHLKQCSEALKRINLMDDNATDDWIRSQVAKSQTFTFGTPPDLIFYCQDPFRYYAVYFRPHVHRLLATMQRYRRQGALKIGIVTAAHRSYATPVCEALFDTKRFQEMVDVYVCKHELSARSITVRKSLLSRIARCNSMPSVATKPLVPLNGMEMGRMLLPKAATLSKELCGGSRKSRSMSTMHKPGVYSAMDTLSAVVSDTLFPTFGKGPAKIVVTPTAQRAVIDQKEDEDFDALSVECVEYDVGQKPSTTATTFKTETPRSSGKVTPIFFRCQATPEAMRQQSGARPTDGGDTSGSDSNASLDECVLLSVPTKSKKRAAEIANACIGDSYIIDDNLNNFDKATRGGGHLFHILPFRKQPTKSWMAPVIDRELHKAELFVHNVVTAHSARHSSEAALDGGGGNRVGDGGSVGAVADGTCEVRKPSMVDAVLADFRDQFMAYHRAVTRVETAMSSASKKSKMKLASEMKAMSSATTSSTLPSTPSPMTPLSAPTKNGCITPTFTLTPSTCRSSASGGIAMVQLKEGSLSSTSASSEMSMPEWVKFFTQLSQARVAKADIAATRNNEATRVAHMYSDVTGSLSQVGGDFAKWDTFHQHLLFWIHRINARSGGRRHGGAMSEPIRLAVVLIAFQRFYYAAFRTVGSRKVNLFFGHFLYACHTLVAKQLLSDEEMLNENGSLSGARWFQNQCVEFMGIFKSASEKMAKLSDKRMAEYMQFLSFCMEKVRVQLTAPLVVEGMWQREACDGGGGGRSKGRGARHCDARTNGVHPFIGAVRRYAAALIDFTVRNDKLFAKIGCSNV